MNEKHEYVSNLSFGNINHNLVDLKTKVLSFLYSNSLSVFKYSNSSDSESISNGNLWGFHKDGISAHLQYITIGKNPYVLDLKLVSDLTPTIDLEVKIQEIAKKYLKQY